MTVDGERVGVVGEVDPGVLEAYGIPGRVAWLELDLDVLLDLEPAIAAVGAGQPLPVERHRPRLRGRRRRHRPTTLRAAIAGAAGAAAGRPRPVRRVPRAGDPDGQRSLAFRLRLQAADHTLTDAEVAAVREPSSPRPASSAPTHCRSPARRARSGAAGLPAASTSRRA